MDGEPSATCRDNGSELTSYTFTERCQAKGIQARFIKPGNPDQNAFVGRFKQTYRDEVLTPHLLDSIEDARQNTLDWVARYNEIRPYDALGRLPPARFREQLFAAETHSKRVYLTKMLTGPLRLNPLGARKVLKSTEGAPPLGVSAYDATTMKISSSLAAATHEKLH